MALLTVIYSPDIKILQRFKARATHWLPENDNLSNNIYIPPNVICTMKDTSLELVKSLINSGKVHYSKVVWIMAKPKESTAYTFDKDGNVNNFFNVE